MFPTSILLIAFAVPGLLIAWFIGRKKRIGFGWTLFFSMTFSPVTALVFALVSPPVNRIPPQDTKGGWVNSIFAWLFLVNLAIFISQSIVYYQMGREDKYARSILPAIGCIGMIYYLLNRSKRNQQAFTKFEIRGTGYERINP